MVAMVADELGKDVAAEVKMDNEVAEDIEEIILPASAVFVLF